jgi:hypothetical protein
MQGRRLRSTGRGTRPGPLIGLAVVSCAVAACSSAPSSSNTSASSAPSTSTSAVAPTTTQAPLTTTTTAAAVPSSPRPNADQAANVLVSDWAAGDKTGAMTVATPQAVSTLFALPYPNGLAIDRGCSTGGSTVTCTFGPPGGANPNDPIYSLSVTQAPAGWYVQSAQVLG